MSAVARSGEQRSASPVRSHSISNQSDSTIQPTFLQQIGQRDYAAAYISAKKFIHVRNRDDAFLEIIRKNPMSPIAQKAVARISSYSKSDEAYSLMIRYKLDRRDFNGAFEFISKLNFSSSADAFYLEIVEENLTNPTALRAANEISSYSKADRAHSMLIRTKLSQGNHEEALELLSKILYSATANRLLEEMQQNVLALPASAFNERVLQKMELGVERASYNNQKVFYRALERKFSRLEDFHLASRMDLKIRQIEEDREAVDHFVNVAMRAIVNTAVVGSIVGVGAMVAGTVIAPVAGLVALAAIPVTIIALPIIIPCAVIAAPFVAAGGIIATATAVIAGPFLATAGLVILAAALRR